MPAVTLSESRDIEYLAAALREADESDSRIRAVLMDSNTTAYEVLLDGQRAGGVVMHWQGRDSELVYIALDESQRGTGIGKAVIARIAAEARRRSVTSVLVGTSNASLGTIAFYQKCGFRMDSVRRDFFDYFAEPVFEDGIQLRDMLVLRLDL